MTEAYRTTTLLAYNFGVQSPTGATDRKERMDGVFDVQDSPDGFYWTYTTPNGGMFLGPDRHRTKAAAKKAGQQWLEMQAA